MTLQFEKIRPVNYVRTKQGLYTLSDLTDKEFREYIKLNNIALRERRAEQKKIKNLLLKNDG